MKGNNRSWRHRLSGTQQGEVELATWYKTYMGHGTLDHDRLILIATLVDMLDWMASQLDLATGTDKVAHNGMSDAERDSSPE